MEGFALPNAGKSKSEQLAAAGIATSTAQRYEELAGPKEEQAEAITGESNRPRQSRRSKKESFRG